MKTKDQIGREALSIVLKYDRSCIVSSMGTGKTKMGLDYIDHYYNHSPILKVLVVAPKTAIFESWKDDMIKFKLTHLKPQIKFSTYLSLNKQDLDYDIIILDEVHSLILGSHDEWLSQFKGRILGLTGTKPRFNSERGRMISKYCPIRYEYTTDEAIEHGILNDYQIIVHSLSLDKNKTIKKTSKSGGIWYTSEIAEYNYWNSRILNAKSDKEKLMMRILRMKSIMSFNTKEVYSKKLFNSISEKVIIFANTQAQADSLCKDSYHSKNPLSEENLINFKEGIITKLSAVEQLSEGINISGLKVIIILHTFSGDSPKSRQKLGRTLRLNIKDTAIIHMLMYKNTIDETWVNSVLELFDPSKVTFK